MLKTSPPKSTASKIEKTFPAENPPSNWQTYRTRFTIRARILSAPLSFVDALGREQNGKRGDYLIESNGMVTITPRHIFEDVYVPLESASQFGNGTNAGSADSLSAQPPKKSPISTIKRSYMTGSVAAPVNTTVIIPLKRRTYRGNLFGHFEGPISCTRLLTGPRYRRNFTSPSSFIPPNGAGKTAGKVGAGSRFRVPHLANDMPLKTK